MLRKTGKLLTSLILLLAWCMPLPGFAADDGHDIELVDLPLMSGSQFWPNILIAMDDSTSMEAETMFPTSDGYLHWSASEEAFWKEGEFMEQGHKLSAYRYMYLFPNGYIDERVGKDGRRRKNPAIPPIPVFGFARSAEYNTAYFDPGATYDPWPMHGDADPKAARFEPTIDNMIQDLTSTWRRTGKRGTKFKYHDGMTIPVGAELANYTHVDDLDEITKNHGDAEQVGEGYPENQFFRLNTAIEVEKGETTGHSTYDTAFFPATFYLSSPDKLPDDYGWKEGQEELFKTAVGELYRFQIKPDNFKDGDYYDAAIQNFANWFSYYRSRHLAARAAVSLASEDMENVRVGITTIHADKNSMGISELAEGGSGESKEAFYHEAYDSMLPLRSRTPNLPALYYLGNQFETNNSIVQSACQRNYALLFTDGQNNEFLSSDQKADVGDVDEDGYANTMGDVAARFYEHLDLSGLNDVVDWDILKDTISKPRVTTFAISLGSREGIIFNSPEYQKENEDPFTHEPPWYVDEQGTKISGSSIKGAGGLGAQIDDLWHATLNSDGEFLTTNNPSQLAEEFGKIVEEILAREENLPNGVGNSTELSSGAVYYRSAYDTSFWAGDLVAFNADDDSVKWHAAERIPAWDKRTIVTSDGEQGIDFKKSSTVLTGDIGMTADEIAYLRGQRANEANNGGTFRNRGATVLGDILNSVPVFVGHPDPRRYVDGWQDNLHDPQGAQMPENTGQAYTADINLGGGSNFVAAHADRTPVVYVGANDGMLHAFEAETGREVFAFVPHAVLKTLVEGSDAFASPEYEHRAFVDGQVAVAPAFFDGEWHTVLVGGLRNGGNAIYALDITDPDRFNKSDVLWEISSQDGDFDNLGRTFGTPQIVRLHSGQWAVIFSSGYNSVDHGAGLYVADVKNGELITYLDTETSPATTDHQKSNGLATPLPVDLDGDYVTDFVYAGDFYGNVWRFDLTSERPVDWQVHKVFDGAADGRPITTQLQAALHPYETGIVLYFGTGQDIQPIPDEPSGWTNRFYGVLDRDGVLPANVTSGPVTHDDLVEQSIENITPDGADDKLEYRTVQGEDNIDYTLKSGWVINLEGTEAVITDPRIVDDNVQFTTRTTSSSGCTLTTRGFFMAVSLTSGTALDRNLFDINGDGLINAADGGLWQIAGIGFETGRGSAGRGARFTNPQGAYDLLKLPMTGGGVFSLEVGRAKDAAVTGRQSWREIRRL